MGVSLEVYKAAVGLFDGLIDYVCYKVFNLCVSSLIDLLCGCIFTLILLFSVLILLSGDVQINPGPFTNFTLNIGHINARSLNDVDKFEEIVSMVIHHKLDIFAVSETWLNNSISSDLFSIPGFSPMFRLDRCDGRKAGGSALTTNFHILVSREGGWLGISRTIKF